MTGHFPTPDYGYRSASPSPIHAVLWPALRSSLLRRCPPPRRLLDFGCGNGATANMLARLGYEVTGVDLSPSGIAQARAAFPDLAFERADVLETGALVADLGHFDVVVSLEVIEHLYAPRVFMRSFHALLREGGTGVISTPYHGYLKNLAIALTGRCDTHFSPLWDGGHIKFWSIRTLRALLREQGFDAPTFLRVGRVPPLAMSMLAVFEKTGA